MHITDRKRIAPLRCVVVSPYNAPSLTIFVVCVQGEEVDWKIDGMKNRNRAFHEDVVVLERIEEETKQRGDASESDEGDSGSDENERVVVNAGDTTVNAVGGGGEVCNSIAAVR